MFSPITIVDEIIDSINFGSISPNMEERILSTKSNDWNDYKSLDTFNKLIMLLIVEPTSSTILLLMELIFVSNVGVYDKLVTSVLFTRFKI
jgi:hypothetical protein